jgi:hypothetical protein
MLRAIVFSLQVMQTTPIWRHANCSGSLPTVAKDEFVGASARFHATYTFPRVAVSRLNRARYF